MHKLRGPVAPFWLSIGAAPIGAVQSRVLRLQQHRRTRPNPGAGEPVELLFILGVLAQAVTLVVVFLVNLAFTSRGTCHVSRSASMPALVPATLITPAGV